MSMIISYDYFVYSCKNEYKLYQILLITTNLINNDNDCSFYTYAFRNLKYL